MGNGSQHELIMKMNIDSLIDVCVSDLEEIRCGKVLPKQALKNKIKRFLGRSVSEKSRIFWPAGMLLLGLDEALAKDRLTEKIVSYLAQYFDTWIQTDGQIQHVDDAIAGLTLFDLYEITGEKKYYHVLEDMTTFLETYERDGGESIVYNAKAQNQYIFADGVGQTAAYLTKAGKRFERESLIQLGEHQLKEFYKNGRDLKTGLPYHAFSRKQDKKLGIVGWGRALGWLFLGYGSALLYGSKSQREEISNQFLEMIDVVKRYQRPDGGFGWMLQAMEGEPDTSATAMIGYGILQGMKAKVVKKENCIQMINKIFVFIKDNTTDGIVGQCLGDCVDLAMHPQIFGHFPCGQGASLAFIATAQELL